MATGRNVHTFVQGSGHDSDMAMMRAADHGSWLGAHGIRRGALR